MPAVHAQVKLHFKSRKENDFLTGQLEDCTRKHEGAGGVARMQRQLDRTMRAMDQKELDDLMDAVGDGADASALSILDQDGDGKTSSAEMQSFVEFAAMIDQDGDHAVDERVRGPSAPLHVCHLPCQAASTTAVQSTSGLPFHLRSQLRMWLHVQETELWRNMVCATLKMHVQPDFLLRICIEFYATLKEKRSATGGDEHRLDRQHRWPDGDREARPERLPQQVSATES